MRPHVGEAPLRNLPVAAIRIPAPVVIGLPAVVDDQPFHAVLRGKRAFTLQLRREELLVVAVPGGVERLVSGRRNGGGHIFRKGGKPGEGVADRVGIEERPEIEPQLRMIRRNRRFRTGKEFDRANDFTAFLVHSGFEPHGTHGLGNGEQQTVFPGLAAEQQHRRGGRQVGIQRRTPVGRNFSDESPVRLPEEVHVHERHAPFDSQPGRRLRLRTLQVKPDQFQPGFNSLPGGSRPPAAELPGQLDLSNQTRDFHSIL